MFFLPPFAQADGLSPVSPARAKVEPEPNLSPPSPKNDVETAAEEVTGGNSRAPLLELSPRSSAVPLEVFFLCPLMSIDVCRVMGCTDFVLNFLGDFLLKEWRGLYCK